MTAGIEAVYVHGGRVWPDDVVRSVVTRYRNGESIRRIANDVDIPYSTVHAKLIDLGEHSPTPQRSLWTDELIAEVGARRRRGETIESIAADIGITGQALGVRLASLGIVPDHSRDALWPGDLLIHIAGRYLGGEPVRRIAVDIGRSWNATYRQLSLLGVYREKYHRMTAEDRDRIKDLYVNGGLSVPEIVKVTGRSGYTTRLVLVRAGLLDPSECRPVSATEEEVWTSDLVETVVTRRQKGDSVADIAADVRVPQSTVGLKLQQLGVQPETSLIDRVPAALKEEVGRCYGEGATIRQVAAETGLSRQQVVRVLEQAGMARRPRGTRSTWRKGNSGLLRLPKS